MEAVRSQKHYYIYLFGLSLMLVGLPSSKFLMSLSQMVLGLNWLIEGHFAEKFRRFFRNKAALAFCCIYILHLIGMIYSTDLQYGFKDLRIKLPLLILPFIIASSKPIRMADLERLLLLFIAAVFVCTIISTVVLLELTSIQVNDTRDISLFISHIRFSLLICLSIFMLAWFIYKKRVDNRLRLVVLALITWFIVFLFLLKSVTGLLTFFIISCSVAVYFIFRPGNRKTKFLIAGSLIVVLGLTTYYVYRSINLFYAHKNTTAVPLDTYTKKGNPYLHIMESKIEENGNLVYVNISWEELEETWNSRSKIDFRSTDKKGNYVYQTLVRFLASKGLKKDAEGVNQLTDAEIEDIENGIANVNYKSLSGMDARVNEIIWEFDNYTKGANPSGNSITQRLEYWKAAKEIFKKAPIIGVGTGDVKNSFKNYYAKTQSQLGERWRLRSHNQFLSICVTFGLVGMLVFAFAILYPSYGAFRSGNYFYCIFFIIAMLSMISEDTLETQAGVSFFAFFTALFLFGVEPWNEVGKS